MDPDKQMGLEETKLHMPTGIAQLFARKARGVHQRMIIEEVRMFIEEIDEYQQLHPTPALRIWLERIHKNLAKQNKEKIGDLLKQFE